LRWLGRQLGDRPLPAPELIHLDNVMIGQFADHQAGARDMRIVEEHHCIGARHG